MKHSRSPRLRVCPPNLNTQALDPLAVLVEVKLAHSLTSSLFPSSLQQALDLTGTCLLLEGGPLVLSTLVHLTQLSLRACTWGVPGSGEVWGEVDVGEVEEWNAVLRPRSVAEGLEVGGCGESLKGWVRHRCMLSCAGGWVCSVQWPRGMAEGMCR